MPFKFKLISFLLLGVTRLLKFTYRFKYTGLENFQLAQTFHPQKSFLISMWHQQAVAVMVSQVGQPYSLLASQSKDGDLIAFICEKLGFRPIRGSSSRGGDQALKDMEKALKEGAAVAITVDGPRGPLYQCKPGIVKLSSSLQIPLIPYSMAASKNYIFHKSWDKHHLPRPGARIIGRYGPPLHLPKLSLEELRDTYSEGFQRCLKQVEEALHINQRRAEEDLRNWQKIKRNDQLITLKVPLG